MAASNETDILHQLQQINAELARQNADLRARQKELQEHLIEERSGYTHRLVDYAFHRAAWLKMRLGKLRVMIGRG